MKFRFHPDALKEYEGSTRYYRAINPQPAQSFVHEIEKSIKLNTSESNGIDNG